MHHLRIQRGTADQASVAAVWPRIEDALAAREAAAPARSADFTPTPAAPDVPATVGRLIVGAYAALVAVFFGLFARSPAALLAITICAVFVTVFFAVPRIFFAVEGDPTRRPSFDRFLSQGISTPTGRTGGADALIQMLIVPVLLTLGLAAMGVIGLIYIR